MNNAHEQMIIRKAAKDDAWQIADILVEDWKIAYRGIIDSDYLDAPVCDFPVFHKDVCNLPVIVFCCFSDNHLFMSVIHNTPP